MSVSMDERGRVVAFADGNDNDVPRCQCGKRSVVIHDDVEDQGPVLFTLHYCAPMIVPCVVFTYELLPEDE